MEILNAIIKEAQMMAELELLQERPDIAENINRQQYVNDLMKIGDVNEAANQQKENLEAQQLIQYGGSR